MQDIGPVLNSKDCTHTNVLQTRKWKIGKTVTKCENQSKFKITDSLIIDYCWMFLEMQNLKKSYQFFPKINDNRDILITQIFSLYGKI